MDLIGVIMNAGEGMGVFRAQVGPRGRARVHKRLYRPNGWINDPARCDAAGVPKERQGYHSETDLALEMLTEAQARGHLTAEWVTGESCASLSWSV